MTSWCSKGSCTCCIPGSRGMTWRRRGLQPHPRPFGGLLSGPSPGRPCARRLQAPSSGRCQRRPAGNHADRRQSQRHHPAPAAARRAARPPGGRQARPPGQKAHLVLADRGCDHDKHRRRLWARGIKPVVVGRGAATARISAGNAGSRSAASRTCTPFAGCAPATNATSRCTRRSSASPARDPLPQKAPVILKDLRGGLV